MLSLFSFKRVIYKRHKTYIYDAFYIKANGDTLTKEIIILKPKGRPWLFQFSQTAYKINYFPQTDSLFDWINPMNKLQEFREKFKLKKEKKGEIWNDLWSKKNSSGAVENENEVWSHPFRSNQYNITEIAPFPEIYKDKLHQDSTWESSLTLGWDNWKGTINYKYTTLGRKDYIYKAVNLDSCWEINASGKHSNPNLGTNWNRYLYHPEFGFVLLNYTFYNGVKIVFKLKEVIDRRNKI